MAPEPLIEPHERLGEGADPIDEMWNRQILPPRVNHTFTDDVYAPAEHRTLSTSTYVRDTDGVRVFEATCECGAYWRSREYLVVVGLIAKHSEIHGIRWEALVTLDNEWGPKQTHTVRELADAVEPGPQQDPEVAAAIADQERETLRDRGLLADDTVNWANTVAPGPPQSIGVMVYRNALDALIREHDQVADQLTGSIRNRRELENRVILATRLLSYLRDAATLTDPQREAIDELLEAWT